MTARLPKLEIRRPGRIYDLLRTSRLNEKYYGYKLQKLQLYNKVFEIGIAVGATGSGISGWSLWGTPQAHIAWVLIAGTSGLAAIAKPILAWNHTIERYSKLFSGHHRNFILLDQLRFEIATQKQVSAEANARYVRIYAEYAELSKLDDPIPHNRLLDRLQEQVNAEIPIDSLWWP